MIISKIYGGCGNQLFQYAFGLAQARRLQTELKLDIDILLYNPYNYTPYDFELRNFEGVDEQIVTKVKDFQIVEEGKLGTNEIRNNSLLDGYWQEEYLFNRVKEELRKKLVFKNKVVSNIAEDSVSIHARRGDYIGDHFADLSKTDYYQRSIEYIKNRVKNPIFYIFSNDVEWSKQYFSFIKEEKIFMPQGSPTNDLQLISLCKHNITANSTYSWWGAWLNNNQSKIVIQPIPWLKKQNIEKLKLEGSVLI